MALEMKSECELCEKSLSLVDDCYICSYECTYCSECTNSLSSKCKNCDGELVKRPKRVIDGFICERL